ncbi:TSL-kinase interacting protein 1 isoform X2 [Ricinus communis]|uniref:TSL-kinase interacting protein 1 isoform X2 n=1 Tax=Ricinus communis TaxID=3988 RepID=UPI00201B0EE2|nr:TSL-kinase interacting protein 1 isoform X2 [Ricinus communis]
MNAAFFLFYSVGSLQGSWTSMKKQMAKVAEAPKKLKVGAGSTQVGKSANRNRGRCPKSAGKSEKLSVEKDKHSSPSGSRLHLLDEGNCPAETTKRFHIPEQCPEHALHLSGKIKLQLFPLDEPTRMGLEKDGYHPYLELTLSARKKISSVLNHLNHKWGDSSIATGEPFLLPYKIAECLSSCRWTLNDVGLSAGDIYAAVGSPSIFRYGWVTDCENKSSELQSTLIPSEACLRHEGIQKVCSNNVENINGKGKQNEDPSEELKPNIVSGATDVSVADKTPSSGLVESMRNEGKMHVGTGQSSLWDDALTNISIGGLLSEASLKGMFSTCEPKSDGSNAGLLPSQLISDSFDAFIMSQVNCSQAPRLPPHGTSSSILDAEDTCHAFAFQNFSSSGKDALALRESAYGHTSSQDAVSKSFKNPNISEVSIQSGLPQSHGCQESETDLSLCSRLYNDESSLGLSGIKWTDSLGPFDLGLSSSRKIISGDSLSISRIIT